MKGNPTASIPKTKLTITMSMWSVTLSPPPRQYLPHLPKHINPPLTLTVSASRRHRSAPPKNDIVSAESIGGLGHSLLTAVNSNSNPKTQTQKQKQEKPKQEIREEGNQISGSDVLWALHRAASQKKKVSDDKRNKKRKGLSSSARGSTGEDCVDYSNLRPLRIEGEWGIKLDELEKRLKELDDTI